MRSNDIDQVRVCSLGVLLMILGGGLAGCGSGAPKIEYADVTGKVTYKGEALKMGQVSFQPATGARTVGEIQKDGTYSLKGVVGKNAVAIESHEPSAAPDSPDAPKMKKADPITYIPLKYAGNSSGLSFEVKAGTKNTADFDLQ